MPTRRRLAILAFFLTAGATVMPQVNPLAPSRNPLAGPKDDRAKLPESLRLKQHVFPDASMGAPVAYTAIAPADWTSEGVVEWRMIGEVPFPQTKFMLNSPNGGKVMFVPNVTFAFTDAPGLGQRQGEPAPENFPQWLAEALPRYNKKVTDVRLVSDRRNEQLEATYAENDRQTGANTQGMRRECWAIVLDYTDETGERRREESSITFAAYPPFHGINGFFTQSWAMFYGPLVSAPVESFEAQKPMLYSVVGTVRPTLRWFTASQAQIAENSRRRSERIWDDIRRRGQQINQMPISTADESAYSKGLGSDKAQRDRVNTIYETDDFKDTDGGTVNLPMYYHHVFSDGKGNYVLTNNSLDKPGETWSEINRIK